MPRLMHQINQPEILPSPYAASDYLSFRWQFLQPQNGVHRQWLFIWANHARVSRPNPQPLSDHGIYYSTPERANAATMARALSAIGKIDEAMEWVAAGGLQVLDTLPVDGTSTDTVHLIPDVSNIIHGIALDYECHDDRSPVVTDTLFRAWRDEITEATSFGTLLYTNRPGSPGWEDSGLLHREGLAARAFDFVSLFAHSAQTPDVLAELDRQAAVFVDKGPAEPGQFFVTHELADNRGIHTQDVAAWVEENGAAGVNVWRNGVTPESDEWAELRFFERWLNDEQRNPNAELVLTVDQRVEALEARVAALEAAGG